MTLPAPTVPVPVVDPGTSNRPLDDSDGAAGAAAAGTTARPPPRRRWRRAAMALLVVVVLGGAALVVVLGGGRQHPRAPAPALSASALDKLSPAAAFQFLVTTSTRANRLAASAAAEACATRPPGSAARQSLLGQLSRAAGMETAIPALLLADQRRLSSLPQAKSLLALLGQVSRASAQVDRSYRAWLQDLQATGCYSAPTNDVHYLEAERDSATAAAAGRRLSAAWDSVAGE